MKVLLATLLDMIMAIIATEAITQLLTKSEFSIQFIKKPLYKWRHIKASGFLHDILDCGYCTSVWAAILTAIWFFTDTPGTGVLDVIILVLVIHRMSNLLHFIIDWIDEKRTRDLNFIPEKEKKDELEERLR